MYLIIWISNFNHHDVITKAQHDFTFFNKKENKEKFKPLFVYSI